MIVEIRFPIQIFRSIIRMPYELKDICCHINEAIEQQYPGYGVRSVSAFLFLRFYCVSITVPEVYGPLKGKHGSSFLFYSHSSFLSRTTQHRAAQDICACDEDLLGFGILLFIWITNS